MSLLASAAQIALAVLGCGVGAGVTLGGACSTAICIPEDRTAAILCAGFGLILFVIAAACLVGLIV